MVTKPIQKYTLTVMYPPSPTSNGGAYVKDEDGNKNFGDASLLNLEQKDVIDVERTYNAPKGKFGESFNIVKWTPHVSGPAQLNLVKPEAPKPFLRPRTDPADQRQMWVTALMKEWMAAYAQSLSITTTGEMKRADAGVMEQAARACGVTYDRLFGPMTQSNKPPPVDEDMNDEIGF
jgi:hypothetical protein